jgi:hypothetical protein
VIIKRFFISRKTVLGWLLLLLCSFVLSFLVPQEFGVDQEMLVKWRAAHQAWLPLVDFLSLHQLYTAPWFVAILSLFLVSLVFSTFDQARISLQKTFAFSSSSLAGQQRDTSFSLVKPDQDLAKPLRQLGYLRVGANGDANASRYVKHPWGYWGNFLLHLGILLVVASSVVITATKKQGVIRLAEGQIHHPGQPWLHEEHGMLVEPLILPASVRLLKLTPEYGKKNRLKNLRSVVNFVSDQRQVNRQVVAIDPILNYHGLRVYQEAEFGYDFYLILIDQEGEKGKAVIDLPASYNKDKATYGDFDFDGIPYHVQAKYYADAEKKSLVSDNPLLALRLLEDDNVLGEVALTKEVSRGMLGPYKVQLVKAKRWTYFIFLDTSGMNGVFLGFFIIILGGMLSYFTIPREFNCVRKDDGELLVYWKGSRFKSHYQNEFERVKAMLLDDESVRRDG